MIDGMAISFVGFLFYHYWITFLIDLGYVVAALLGLASGFPSLIDYVLGGRFPTPKKRLHKSVCFYYLELHFLMSSGVMFIKVYARQM